jgi:2,3-bisphosphoglycerate-independent phosphoglycerate mutase
MKNHPYHTPAVLIVLDGWGVRDDTEHNAIHHAPTPFFDSLLATYPHCHIDASGTAVGLPEGQMGNSEIGHMAIGAGAKIDTDLVRIDTAIQNGTFVTNEVCETLYSHTITHDTTLHVACLVSPGGIHSHHAHLHEFIRGAQARGVSKLAVHVFLDGRDTAPQSGAQYVEELEQVLRTLGIGHIATITGRFYAMDRDNNWDRVQRAEDAIFLGKSDQYVPAHVSASAYIRTYYETGGFDEHMPPIVCTQPDGTHTRVGKDDAFFFCNFRADRARMFTKRLLELRTTTPILVGTMTEYDESFDCLVAFPPFRPTITIASEVARLGLTQAHIAETEKYAHATYFLNGGREEPHPGEKHILVPSRKDVPTHDLAPEMRAKEIADAAIQELEAGTDFLFINFANADMVGHTANVPAIHIAITTIDRELRRVVEATLAQGGFVFITADHGNAEHNVDTDTGALHTAHTTNLVPGILTQTGYTLENGTLPDVAPTVLTLMGIPVPESMTGHTLASRDLN